MDGNLMNMGKLSNMKIQRLTTIGILAAILFASGSQLWAATLHVSQTSANATPPYATWDTAAPTIQHGVDAANDGDTVLVAAGEYELMNQITITKAIVMESASGPGQTILYPGRIWDFAPWWRLLWIS